MNLLTARNADEMLPLALQRLASIGEDRETRNGPVVQMPGPTILCYERPLERVVFHPERNANPFFHVIEAMWMLAGRNDVEGVSDYASNIVQYSDDGATFRGAYGYRWRRHFGLGKIIDQLDEVVKNLKANPNCRRQVVNMWDVRDLLHMNSKDITCNTHIYFARDKQGRLDMTVCNRSNDLIWGCLGANAVHFAFLLEYMAGRIGCGVGKYYQFTNNLHGYLKTVAPLLSLAESTGMPSRYESQEIKTMPLFTSDEEAEFELDLYRLSNGYYKTKFFIGVVAHMEAAWKTYKKSGPKAAIPTCEKIEAEDWRVAATEWMKRCADKRAAKAQDDGVNYDQ
jgi:thymidylate synthase